MLRYWGTQPALSLLGQNTTEASHQWASSKEIVCTNHDAFLELCSNSKLSDHWRWSHLLSSFKLSAFCWLLKNFICFFRGFELVLLESYADHLIPLDVFLLFIEMRSLSYDDSMTPYGNQNARYLCFSRINNGWIVILTFICSNQHWLQPFDDRLTPHETSCGSSAQDSYSMFSYFWTIRSLVFWHYCSQRVIAEQFFVVGVEFNHLMICWSDNSETSNGCSYLMRLNSVIIYLLYDSDAWILWFICKSLRIFTIWWSSLLKWNLKIMVAVLTPSPLHRAFIVYCPSGHVQIVMPASPIVKHV